MTREYQWFDLGLGLGKALQIALTVWGLSKQSSRLFELGIEKALLSTWFIKMR